MYVLNSTLHSMYAMYITYGYKVAYTRYLPTHDPPLPSDLSKVLRYSSEPHLFYLPRLSSNYLKGALRMLGFYVEATLLPSYSQSVCHTRYLDT